MSGISAFGTELARGDGASPEVFTALANVTGISGPKQSREFLDVTSHDSAGGWEEFVTGIKRTGTLDLDLNYDPTDDTHEQLLDDFDAGSSNTYKITWPSSPTVSWTFEAMVVDVSPEAPFDDKLTCSASFKLSGPVTRP